MSEHSRTPYERALRLQAFVEARLDEDVAAAYRDAPLWGENVGGRTPMNSAARVIDYADALREVVSFNSTAATSEEEGGYYPEEMAEAVARLWATHPDYTERW